MPSTTAASAAFSAGKTGLSGNSYPARALRAEITGHQTIECQVQADGSVICRSVAFDPPENAPFCAGVAEGLFRNVTVTGTRADGGPVAGVRFRFPVNWTIPH